MLYLQFSGDVPIEEITPGQILNKRILTQHRHHADRVANEIYIYIYIDDHCTTEINKSEDNLNPMMKEILYTPISKCKTYINSICFIVMK